MNLSRSYDGGHLHFNNTLKIFAVNQTHSGTYTCTGYSETGVMMVNAQLKVLGKEVRKRRAIRRRRGNVVVF